MQRFFVPDPLPEDGIIRITGEDCSHIGLSLRMKVGDYLSVCDSAGICCRCRILSIKPEMVCAEVLDSAPSTAEPPYRVCLYQALPKGDKFDTIIQKAVECGVYEIVPFESAFCVAKMGDRSEKKLERWNRIAREAAKQCGRGRIPQVLPPLSFQAMVEAAAKAELPLFCYEREITEKLGKLLSGNEHEIAVVVGSEGGFSPDEARYASEHGLKSCGLGERILRCETASGFVLACISLIWELS